MLFGNAAAHIIASGSFLCLVMIQTKPLLFWWDPSILVPNMWLNKS
jgi:hypothetical protein